MFMNVLNFVAVCVVVNEYRCYGYNYPHCIAAGIAVLELELLRNLSRLSFMGVGSGGDN